MLVTEFFDGAVEIGDAEVDDQIIDEGLALVRRLWDAGLAHRDIKPANLLVKDGHLVLIDVAFAQVRPSPWREAVDLANMMLVLAVRTDAERVYRRALALLHARRDRRGVRRRPGHRQPDAAAHGDEAGRSRPRRPSSGPWRPARRPISLQRWGPRRVLMALGLAVLAVLALVNVYGMFTPAELPIGEEPSVRHRRRDDPDGPGGPDAPPRSRASPRSRPGGRSAASGSRRGDARFWLDSDQAGGHAVEVAPAAARRVRGRRRHRGAERRAGMAAVRAARAAAARRCGPCARTSPTAPA